MKTREQLIVEIYNKIVEWYNEENLTKEEKENLLLNVTMEIINMVINFIKESIDEEANISEELNEKENNNPQL